MALSGTLETFSLPDVLRLLSSTKKTGLLALDGDRGTGRVWVDGGDIVAASADRSVVDDVDAALFELLRFDDAGFEFDATPEPPVSDVRRDVEEAVAVAEARLAEWCDIEAVVPSLDVRVRMVAEIDRELTVTADVWRVLATVGSGASGHDVARTLGQAEFDVCRTLRDLVEGGMVEITAVEAATVAPEPEPTWSWDAQPEPADQIADELLPDEPIAEEPIAEEPVVDEPVVDEPAVLLSDLALLSPRAAAAVEAASVEPASVAPVEPGAEALADEAPAASAGDEVDQNLLLRFLSSARH